MRNLQNRLWVLWRGVNRSSSNKICSRSSSAITNTSGSNSRRYSTGAGFTVGYRQKPNGRAVWRTFLGVYSRKPPSLGKMTSEAAEAVSKVSPAVVSLYFRKGRRLLGQCSGTIIDADGTILTCAHLMRFHRSEKALKKMKVTVMVDKGAKFGCYKFEGDVVNADFHYDIAFIKITPRDSLGPLPTAKLGTTHHLSLGDVVVSISRFAISRHDPFPQLLATQGDYVSGLQREGVTFTRGGLFGELIPVTCSVMGCGGPVVNCRGEVVGVMSSKKWVYSYAISVDIVSQILDHFKKFGRVIQARLGVAIAELNERSIVQIEGGNVMANDCEGVIVFAVTPNSSADHAGLLPGDVVIEFDGKRVGSFHEFIEVMWDKVGKPLKMVVRRSANVSLTLTVIPDEAGPDTYDWRVIQPCLGVTISYPKERNVAKVEQGDKSLSNVKDGVVVRRVLSGSPAYSAGLIPGDVIIKFDGKCIGSFQEFTDVMRYKAGKPLKMIVKRLNDIYDTLTAIPDEASPKIYDSECMADEKNWWLS